jgi:hypothetical protein
MAVGRELERDPDPDAREDVRVRAEIRGRLVRRRVAVPRSYRDVRARHGGDLRELLCGRRGPVPADRQNADVGAAKAARREQRAQVADTTVRAQRVVVETDGREPGGGDRVEDGLERPRRCRLGHVLVAAGKADPVDGERRVPRRVHDPSQPHSRLPS